MDVEREPLPSSFCPITIPPTAGLKIREREEEEILWEKERANGNVETIRKIYMDKIQQNWKEENADIWRVPPPLKKTPDRTRRIKQDESRKTRRARKRKKISPSNLQFTNFIDCPSEREKERKPLENARSTNERKEKRGTEGVEQQVVASVERRQR